MSKKLFFIFLLILSSHTVNAQYCTAIGPSSTVDSNVESVSIIGESSSSISYTGCPGIIGLEDLSGSENVILNAGDSYTMNVQFGTCGGNFTGAGEVYIDFNMDQMFDITEIIGSWSGTPPTALSVFNFTVPASSIDGVGRIRVIQDESSSNPINPCSAFTWGSAVDFGVTITGGVDCSGYIGNERTDPRLISTLPFQESYNSSFCYSNNDPVYISSDVFYQLIVSEFDYDFIKVSLCGSSFDTYLSIQDLDTNILYVNDDNDLCAPQSELTFPTIGLDTVLVIVQGWGTESGDYELNIQEDISANTTDLELENIQIFPNPASDFIIIRNVPMKSEYKIYNDIGQLMKEGIIFENKEISIQELAPGFYPIEVKSVDQQKMFKLIVTE